MNTQASNVDISQAVAGMVLAEDLADQGAVLLPSGATLTDATLNSLRRRGISTLSILSPAGEADTAAQQAERARQLARLDQLFRHSGAQGAGPALLACLRNYREGD